ncbi:MAG: WD40 repeat domain-containing protein, partial [bacterium]|nr:WD40 repeat domain-containing protein [bacterium]
DDITGICLHPDGTLIATGEIGPKPLICVWDSSTMELVHKWKGGIVKGVACMSFSPSGKYLVVCGIDTEHKIGLYDVKRGKKLVVDKGDTAIIGACAFISDKQIVTVGVKHYKLWSYSGGKLKGKKGLFGRNDNKLTCVTICGSDILAGSLKGHFQIWKGNNVGKVIKLHKKSMDAIFVNDA